MRYTPLLLAALFLGGCATLPSPATGPDRSGPLEAWIVPHEMGGIDGGQINFFVSRPAHVAIYQIGSMGGGAALVYPRHGGTSSIRYAGFNAGYLGAPRSRAAAAQFAFFPTAGRMGGFGPTYYLLIASEHPLDVGRFAMSPLTLRREIPSMPTLGVNHLANELVQLSFGGTMPPPGEWTMDLYAHWPMMRAPRTILAMDSGIRFVQCPGGQVLTVVVGEPVLCPTVDDADVEDETKEQEDAIRRYVEGRRDRGAARGDGAATDAIRALADERRERIRRTVEARERAAGMREVRESEHVRQRNRGTRDAHRTRATPQRPTTEARPAAPRARPAASPGETRSAPPPQPETRPAPRRETRPSPPTSSSQQERREPTPPPTDHADV